MTTHSTIPASASPDDTHPPEGDATVIEPAMPRALISFEFARHVPKEALTVEALQGFANLLIEQMGDGMLQASGGKPEACPVNLATLTASILLPADVKKDVDDADLFTAFLAAVRPDEIDSMQAILLRLPVPFQNVLKTRLMAQLFGESYAVKVRAQLVYAVAVDLAISEKSPLRLLPIDSLLAQANERLAPRLADALNAAALGLRILGVTVSYSGAKLEFQAVESETGG